MNQTNNQNKMFKNPLIYIPFLVDDNFHNLEFSKLIKAGKKEEEKIKKILYKLR